MMPSRNRPNSPPHPPEEIDLKMPVSPAGIKLSTMNQAVVAAIVTSPIMGKGFGFDLAIGK